MTDLVDVLEQVQHQLADAGILSVVIGGLAVAAWGDPRLTRDVDLKVAASRDDVDRLLELLQPDFVLVSPEAEQFARGSGILFLQSRESIRVDLLLSEVGFDLQVIDRGVEVEILPGRRARLCTPEDLVLYKLISTRPRDHSDAQTVVQRQGEKLDHKYVEEWLQEFEIALDDSTLLSSYRAMRSQQ